MNRFLITLGVTAALVFGLSELAVADPSFGPTEVTATECGELWGWAESACLYRLETGN